MSDRNFKEQILAVLDKFPTPSLFFEIYQLKTDTSIVFSNLDAVKDFASQNAAVVVLTSFMLYQYDEKIQKLLIDEILGFTRVTNNQRINQTFNKSSMECFIEFDGGKIIELYGDTCKNWKWLS
jgi:hypothetical protein